MFMVTYINTNNLKFTVPIETFKVLLTFRKALWSFSFIPKSIATFQNLELLSKYASKGISNIRSTNTFFSHSTSKQINIVNTPGTCRENRRGNQEWELKV